MRHLSFCFEEERMLLSIDLDFMTDREKNKLIAHIQHQVNVNQCNKDVAVGAIKVIRKSFERSEKNVAGKVYGCRACNGRLMS